MILVVSRFRVANGMDAEVRAAFAQRPRLVDDVPGFLGMETFTDSKDPNVFVLATRWTDEVAFREWHSSPAHKLSHVGIPRGLKLDPTFTELLVLDRLDDAAQRASFEELAADAPSLLAALLTRTRTTHLFVGALDGTLTRCNGVAADGLGVPAAGPIDRPIWPFLVAHDQDALRALLASGRRRHHDLRLNFVGPSQLPFTLDCVLEVGDGFTLLGEPPRGGEHELQAEHLRLNSELNVMARENARTRRALEEALADLRESHWHVKKLQQVLPMCLDCGRVRKADSSWETPQQFLQHSTDFLSHGYCPECGERVTAQIRAEVRAMHERAERPAE